MFSPQKVGSTLHPEFLERPAPIFALTLHYNDLEFQLKAPEAD